VLNEAAVGRGHVSAHERAARLMGEGTGSIYRLLDGEPELSSVRVAAWITPARGHDVSLLDDFLADGMERFGASLLAAHTPDGVRTTRLPSGWHVDFDPRTPL
jgi:hypothetical protein